MKTTRIRSSALAGTLQSDVTDIGERHDDYIGDALLAELWGDEDE